VSTPCVEVAEHAYTTRPRVREIKRIVVRPLETVVSPELHFTIRVSTYPACSHQTLQARVHARLSHGWSGDLLPIHARDDKRGLYSPPLP